MQRQRRSVDPSYFSCERVEARFHFHFQGESWQDKPLPIPWLAGFSIYIFYW